ncbi:MAG: CorA family divalent cation transporter [bacterium]
MVTRHVRRNVLWIDIVSPSPAEVRGLMDEFKIDSTLAEELLLPSFRPKVEKRGELIYLILHFPVLRGAHQHHEHEIDFLIGKNFLITTRYENVDPLHNFAKAFDADTVLGKDATITHGGHIFIAMARAFYLALGAESDTVRRRLHDIEDHVFSGDERRMVAQISDVGRVIHHFRQALLSHEETLNSLEPVGAKFFGAEFSYHMRELVGTYERVLRRLENLHDSLDELRETNNSLLSTKQNEIMKTLTMMAFVTFPLSLISSIFGMNTHSTPIVGLPGDFWMVLGLMGALALSFFVYFKYRKWL